MSNRPAPAGGRRPRRPGLPAALGPLRRQPSLLALALLLAAALLNYALQPNFFRPATLSGNLRTYLPLALVAAGQTMVIIGGGVDLSLGAVVALANVVVVRLLGDGSDPALLPPALLAGLGAGAAAGLVNGLCVAYLRFQPIVTTFATSFLFSGLALRVMERPGGSVPAEAMALYAARPLGLPLAVWAAALLLLAWAGLRATRYGVYLYAVGGQPQAAYVTGVPVALVRLATYVFAGALAACAAAALALDTGSGSPLVGGSGMTLSSVVAVVLGGTRLSGGQGGMFGSVLGVLILGLIRSVISFANVPTWHQVLVDGLIVMFALAGPGLAALLRRQG
jgi:ribose transport system permease protein